MTTAAAKSLRPPRKPPGPSEVVAIDVARRRVADRPARLTVALETSDGGKVQSIGPEHADLEGWVDRLQDVFATRGSSFACSQLNHLIAVARDADGKCDVGKVNAMLALIEGAKPTNEVEAVLAVQLAVTHELALQAARRALRVEQIGQYDSAGNMAVKLMRTVTLQMEALAKLQRGGEQVVKVVHVHPGAQAVIGTVNATGGRGSEGNENQPHAKGALAALSAAPMPQVRSADAERHAMPVARRGG